jgi:hypothetical protein
MPLTLTDSFRGSKVAANSTIDDQLSKFAGISDGFIFDEAMGSGSDFIILPNVIDETRR